MSAWSPEDEFASDLVRDLAIARLLITSGWHLLDQAGAPRWALRAARLACQARLAAADAGSELERTTIQAVFDELAKEHGSRWAEVPMEALLTLGNAQDALTRAWPALHYRAARRGVLEQCRLRRLKTMVWTVNDDHALARWLAHPCVDIVVTDRPAHAVALRAR
jgi:glycerophosphoryl diester phosphodiesterase